MSIVKLIYIGLYIFFGYFMDMVFRFRFPFHVTTTHPLLLWHVPPFKVRSFKVIETINDAIQLPIKVP